MHCCLLVIIVSIESSRRMREKKAEGQVEVSPDKAILLFQEHDKNKALHMYTPCCPSTPLRIRQGLPHCPCLNYQWVRLWQSCCCLRLLDPLCDAGREEGEGHESQRFAAFKLSKHSHPPTDERTNLWLSTQYLPTGRREKLELLAPCRFFFGVWRLVDRKLRE